MNSSSGADFPGTTGREIFESRTGRFFWAITTHKWLVLFLSLVVFVAMAFSLPKLTRDTRAEAFIAADHPSVLYRDQVRDIFGLYDPIVIAVERKGENGVFNPKTLQLVAWLTEEVQKLEGVDPDRITSLATEKDIYGTEDSMEVELFFEYPPETQEEADAVWEKVSDFPLYMGSLVSEDKSMTLIVAELLGGGESEAKNYTDFLALAERAPVENGETIHIAGEGAVSEFLGAYIDRDAKRLNPISALVITLILIVAYRTMRATIIPNLVVLGGLAGSIGVMAAAGVPMFVITNALPVIIIAISVADAIHVLNTYYEELAFHPDETQQELVVRAMVHMWRPVTFTSLTDVAGFMGLSVASFMPPMRYFGVFASTGVMAALFFSLFGLPACLCLLKKKQSAPFKRIVPESGIAKGDVFSKLMGSLGSLVIDYPRAIVIVAAIVSVTGFVGALKITVNEERTSVFQDGEPIKIADIAMNNALDGTNYLDVVVETDEMDGLLEPEVLRRIEALQAHAESLDHVGGTTAITGYLKQMNRAMNEDRKEAYVLPDSAELAAQYFLLYGDPADFEETIDSNYQMANIRIQIPDAMLIEFSPIVEEMERYIKEEFETEGLSAHLAGRINVDYHWLNALARSHFIGVFVAFVAVWLMAAASFRSFTAGLLATMPVALALLAIYAVMGFFDIWLGIGTTMFAAISIGVSVDSSIHTVDRLIQLVNEQRKSVKEAFRILFPSTGRALLFSFLAMALGFSVLMTSEVPPLQHFGALVTLAVTISFISSMTLLPAMVLVFRPAFLKTDETELVIEGDIQSDAVK